MFSTQFVSHHALYSKGLSGCLGQNGGLSAVISIVQGPKKMGILVPTAEDLIMHRWWEQATLDCLHGDLLAGLPQLQVQNVTEEQASPCTRANIPSLYLSFYYPDFSPC